MPSATITLLNIANENQVYTCVGQSADGANFKIATAPLVTPKTLSFKAKVGVPGAQGNDQIMVTLNDTRQNGTTGLVKTISAKLSISIPRDEACTLALATDALAQIASLLSDANCALLANIAVP